MSDPSSPLPSSSLTVKVLLSFIMATDKALLLSAILGGIEVECDVENGKWKAQSQYFVRISVADKEVAKSTNSKPRSSVLKWEWSANNQIWFEPSSMLKAELYRVSRTRIDRLNNLVGQHEGKVVEMLDQNASFDLMDKKGDPVRAKMKIALSPTSESDDDIKVFMERVDTDVSRLPSHGTMWNTVSTVGKTLQLTKNIMDSLSQAHPMLKASWTILSSLYQAVQETDLQDESVRELARTLREMLATANKFRNLEEILNMPNVVEEIGHQSIQVASLIHEYAKLSFARRTGEIQILGLKSRIEKCQKSCAALKVKLSDRINVDTNARVKKIEDRQLAAEINKWLSAPDSSRFHNEAHEKREVNTCAWFLNGKRFIRWRENPGFLWVKGKPGCGKSVLCSSIIEKLPKPKSSLGIAYFFFDGRDGQTDQQRHNKLIRSLISQFSDLRHGGIPMELVELYRNCGAHQPLDYQLQDTLRNILDGFSNAYIVIDALDECTDREKTLNWVNKLVADADWNAKNLHMLVTSRPLRDIEEVFEGLDPHSIDVSEATGNQDIMEYLKFQMNSKSTFKKYDENTQKKIESALAERAEGSFRWVALQLAELGKCASTTEIADQLAKLPKGLNESYNRILRTIDENHHAHTRTFLQWLAFSQRPMTISEIAETITVDFASEGPVFVPGNRYPDPRDVLTRCSGLGIVTGTPTRAGWGAGFVRVRVRVGIFVPYKNPYP
ncbi:hypothetical protein GALMADRAFT_802023 [Galerina marginata CBS 339.88]|uniref:NACHT domain-containing protein n=1 Tax=Galerina marginata (strain CBS 339.88) TaxID=685588 RepID=A0A067SJC3_GALM3|nr:hypothetical protein GALMADRAFT_802023 [Galerina marginata CBS 339.88]